MNMAEITEEKLDELNGVFEALGIKVGTEAGDKAGKGAGENIDPTVPVKEAVRAAVAQAEKAAHKVRALADLAVEEADSQSPCNSFPKIFPVF